ncbi:cationic amino acid transporter 2-like [Gigantopelta aegis]|uniref:cationic amino acid transporter 2-like n=1 Tax=Gigantopelta aegis TaxID=1735272 RepID=UPI001B888E6C|nr:cationic amino acid transporter 2-like [Gigantopelta aegis]
MWTCRRLLTTLTRRKVWAENSHQGPGRERCLNIVDLVGLGLGGSTGLGVYVLSAYIAHVEAGPAAILSIILAGITALLSGFCHAEMSGRLPVSGNSYMFSYSVVGELCAFVTGWSLLLEHVLGAVVAAKGWSHYLDYMLNNTVSSYFSEHTHWQVSGVIDSQPDVLACCGILVATVVLLFSVKIYSVINFALITTSALFVLSFICVGFFHVHINNWTRLPGFFPYGVRGVTSGAAVFFYAFTGIDNIVTSTDDVKLHSHNVPVAIVTTCILSLVLYFGTATSLTLSFPWRDIAEVAPLAKAFEDKDIYAAKYIVGVGAVLGLSAGILAALYVIPRVMVSMSKDGLLPSVFSRISTRTEAPICATILLGFFTAICALVFDFYSCVEMLSIASIFAYFLCALCVLCLRYSTCDVGVYKEYSEFDMDDSSKKPNRHDVRKPENNIPKLEVFHDGNFNLHYANYTTHIRCDYDKELGRSASFGSLQEREERDSYDEDQEEEEEEEEDDEQEEMEEEQNHNNHIKKSKSSCSVKESCYETKSNTSLKDDVITFSETTQLRASMSQQSFNSVVILPGHAQTDPDAQSWKHTKSFILAFIVSSSCLCCSFIVISLDHESRTWWAMAISCVCVVGMIVSSYLISRQPQNRVKTHFRAPYVPFVPLLAMFLSMVLISALSMMAWARFSVWLVIGLVVYWLYGVRHSTTRADDDEEVALYDVTEQQTKVPVQ